MADNALTFSDENFETETKEGLVLVDFWAPWCPPCRMLGPVIEELAADYEGKVKIGKLNIDDNKNTATNFQVQSIPTVILLKDGKPVEEMVGAQSKQAYAQTLDAHLA